MNISFSQIKECEVVNVFDGKRLGRAIDIVFDDVAGYVLGFVLPGIKKGVFKKTEDLFVPISNVVKLGSDVVLVKLEPSNEKPNIVKFKTDKNAMYDFYVYPDKKKEKWFLIYWTKCGANVFDGSQLYEDENLKKLLAISLNLDHIGSKFDASKEHKDWWLFDITFELCLKLCI